MRFSPGGAATAPLRPGATTTKPTPRRPEELTIAIYCAEQAEKSTCRGHSRHLRTVSLLPSGSPSSPRGSWDGPGGLLRRSQSSLGWGGDKARSSGGAVVLKVLCQRRSGAASGSREQVDRSGARIQPRQRSESRPLPTTLTRDTYIRTGIEHSQHRQHYNLRGQRAGRTGTSRRRRVGISSIFTRKTPF